MVATAWYIVPSQRRWARWFNLLHWPYTLWHLSYPVMGAAVAEDLNWPVLGWTVLAFFLGMGIAAHCFDLLQGDPLRLGLKTLWLWLVGGVALTGAVIIGVWQIEAGNVPWQLVFGITGGTVLAVGYGKEWRGLHGDWQFVAWWGVFPLLVGYLAQGLQFHPVILLLCGFAFCSAYVQRILSTRARFLRRKVEGDLSIMTSFSDCLEVDGWAVGKAWMLEPLDRALIWFNALVVLSALILLSWRF